MGQQIPSAVNEMRQVGRGKGRRGLEMRALCATLRALTLGEIILRKLCLEFRTRIRGVTAVKQSTKLK